MSWLISCTLTIGRAEREEGRGKREEGRGKREEGRGKRLAERVEVPVTAARLFCWLFAKAIEGAFAWTPAAVPKVSRLPPPASRLPPPASRLRRRLKPAPSCARIVLM